MHRCLPRLLEKIRCKPQLANAVAFFRRKFFTSSLSRSNTLLFTGLGHLVSEKAVWGDCMKLLEIEMECSGCGGSFGGGN